MSGNAGAFEHSADLTHAFDVVFDLHFGAVHRYIHRRAGVDVADDIAAETFAVAFARRAAFQDRGNGALPWLLGIATNLLHRRRRTEERRLRAYARTGVDAWTSVDEDAAIDRLEAERHGAGLARGLLALRRKDRDVFLLCTLGDLTYGETAEALGIPLGTVATNMRRARDVLGAALADAFDEGSDDG